MSLSLSLSSSSIYGMRQQDCPGAGSSFPVGERWHMNAPPPSTIFFYLNQRCILIAQKMSNFCKELFKIVLLFYYFIQPPLPPQGKKTCEPERAIGLVGGWWWVLSLYPKSVLTLGSPEPVVPNTHCLCPAACVPVC